MANVKLCANDEFYIVDALRKVRDELRECGVKGSMAFSVSDNDDITSSFVVEDGTIMAIQLSDGDDVKTVKYIYGDKSCL